jgi:hypothetical protein
MIRGGQLLFGQFEQTKKQYRFGIRTSFQVLAIEEKVNGKGLVVQLTISLRLNAT